MSRVSTFAVLCCTLACSSRSVDLNGRACETTTDCLDGYTCISSVCVSGSGDSDTTPIDEHLVLGDAFTVDISAATAESVDNFPVLIILPAEHLDRDLVRDDGSNLRFVDLTTGETLSYDLVHWEPDATSQIWVHFAELQGTRRAAIAYGDDTVVAPSNNGWVDNDFVAVFHFESEAPGADATGVAGTLSPTPTVQVGSSGANGYYLPQSAASAQVVRQAGDSTAMTLEFYTLTADNAWTHRTSATLAPATPVEGYQVELPVTGSAQRSVVANGAAVPVWTESLGADAYDVWARTPSGVSSLAMYDGPVEFTEDGFEAVVDSGVSYIQWLNITPTTSKADDALDVLFDGLPASASDAWGNTTIIGCGGGLDVCPLGDHENMAAIFYAWLVSPGSYYLGISSDDAADIALGDAAWEAKPELYVRNYNYDYQPMYAQLGDAVTLPELTRFRFRFLQVGGSYGHIATRGSTGLPQYARGSAIPEDAYRSRKIVQNPPVVTQGAQELLGETLREAGDLVVNVTPTLIHVSIGGAELEAPVDNASHFLSVALAEDGTATLYIDGESATSATIKTPLASSSRQLRVGDVTGDAYAGPSLVDELRFSNVARTPAWIAAQASNLRGATLVTFE